MPEQSDFVYLAEGEHKSGRIIALQKGALVTGYIKDSNMNPLGDIGYGYQGRNCDGWSETDPNGRYQIRLPLGRYIIGLDEEGFVALQQTVTITDISQPVTVPDIIAYSEQSGGQISGTVSNVGGHPKAGGFMVVAFEAGTVLDVNTWYAIQPVGEAELEEAGPFTITALPLGVNYDVYLCVETRTPDEIESIVVRDAGFNVPVGTTGLSLNYDSEGSTVAGSVTNTKGRAVLGAAILLTNSSAGNFAGFGRTDPNGECVICNVPAGTYTATAVHSKYLNSSTSLEVPDNLSDHLVGHWKMNDNSANATVADSSGRGNDGTAQQNTSVLSTAGKVNGGLTFNGTGDYVTIPRESNLITGTNDFTIAGWINPDAVDSITNLIAWQEPSSAVQFIITDGAGNTGIWADSKWLMRIANTFTPGLWYHIIWTRNSDTWKAYIDGSQIGSDVIDGASLGAPTLDYHIGAEATAPSQFFSGTMDNTMIFNTALSEEEIAVLYNGGQGLETIPTFEAPEGTIVMPFAGAKEGADLNGDGVVDLFDGAVFTDQWLQSGSLEGDFNQDDNVNFVDWARLAENWLWKAIWYHD